MAIIQKMVLRKPITGFVQFIREQGVVGLAIGFILGAAINKLVGSLVSDIMQPAIGMMLGSTGNLAELKYGAIAYGRFIGNLIDFTVISAVVYFGFKGLGLDKIDLKKG